MDLEDLVEAELAGGRPEIPDDLREPFGRAMAAHEALRAALGSVECPGGSEADRPPPLLPDDFAVIRELGRGGMGVVYLVRQESLGRLAAVKVLRSGDAAFGPGLRRFLDEARHLARLRHPHIVAVHEVGRDGRGEPYFVMDYVEGEPLTAVLARGRVTPTRALAVLKQVGEAVRHAHERGIIHRDLKPGNILIAEDGSAFVTDFGLARDVTEPADRTGPGGIMGTPSYMAPEQARGQADLVGEATDVHALGAVLYEMLTGRPPYGNDRAADVLARLLREEPRPPRAVDRRIPRDLEPICLTALAKDPSRRYASTASMLEDIRRFEAGLPPRARRLWTSQRVLRLMRRRWRPLAALAAVAAVAGMGLSMVVPRLVGDEAVQQSILAAEWLHREGSHDAAAGLYAAALDQVDRRYGRTLAAVRAEDEPAHRLELLRKVQRCVGEIDDLKVAAAVALPVISKNPWISFPHRDLAIARAAFRSAVALGPRPFENEAARRSDPRRKEAWYLLRLAQRRLELVLEGRAGSPAELDAAERLRARIAEAFATDELPTADEADRGDGPPPLARDLGGK